VRALFIGGNTRVVVQHGPAARCSYCLLASVSPAASETLAADEEQNVSLLVQRGYPVTRHGRRVRTRGTESIQVFSGGQSCSADVSGADWSDYCTQPGGQIRRLHGGRPGVPLLSLPRQGKPPTRHAEGRRASEVIGRWEQAVVAPSVETLAELVRACGFDLPLELEPLDTSGDDRLEKNAMLSPQRRVRRLIAAVERDESNA
jgi:hypothetical protein